MDMKVKGVSDKKEGKKGERDLRFNYFRTFGRIAFILFIGLSVYFLISTLVIIFLTKPVKEVKVPYVVGKQFVEVYNSLVRQGLKPEIRFLDVYDLENGVILNQYPKGGVIVSEGDRIKLMVSRSSLFIDVPNLVGIELPFAINKLKNLHVHKRAISIGAGIISYIPSDKSADNIVIDQNPKPGERITPDRKVNLLVSSGQIEADDTMVGVVNQSIDLCFDLLLAKGLVIVEEIVQVSDKAKSGIVLSQSPSKGAHLKKGDAVRLRVGYYPLREHPYLAYEKISHTIPAKEKSGLYEAAIDDDSSKRVRFSRKMKPGSRMEFIFHRTGNAKVSILCDKRVIEIIKIDVDDFE